MTVIVRAWALPVGQEPTSTDWANCAANNCQFIKQIYGADPAGELYITECEETTE